MTRRSPTNPRPAIGPTRRSVLQSAVLGGVAYLARGLFAEPAPTSRPADDLFPSDAWTNLGRLPTRHSRDIAASSLGVGMETLDRELFEPSKAIARLGELGVKWARLQTGWARCERERGKYDFRWLDEVVDPVIAAGVRPWFSVGYGNRLYSPDSSDPAAVGWYPLRTAEARDAWMRYVAALVEHFKTRVRDWEIWNEPNLDSFWKPDAPSAERYVELVALTVPIIRKAQPDATIIGGALASVPASTKYLQQCLDRGMGDHIDKLSIHPYRANPDRNYARDIEAYRKVLAGVKRPIAVWNGEMGCPSQPGSSGALGDLAWTEVAQAKWVARRAMNDLMLGVEVSSYFLVVDLLQYRRSARNPNGQPNWKGLLRGKDYSPKPSYVAYQSLCSLFDAKTQPADAKVQLEGAAEGVRTAAFIREGRPLYVWWSPADLMKAFKSADASLRAAFAGESRITHPVVVDPLTATVYQPRQAVLGDAQIRLPVPVLDYPLILCDRASLPQA